MRFLNSIRNLIASWIGRLFIVIVTFVTRYVFIKTLGTEYLGVSGLFSNILSVLSLAEMGVGTAVSFSLYQPIKDKDEETIKSILVMFNKFYAFAGSTIVVVGLCITPFLKHLINEMPTDMPYIYLYFILYVLNIGASYILSYKEVLIMADQKKYLYEMNYCFWFSCLNIVQIVALYVTHNYIIFLVLQIIFTLLQNISLSRIANKRYPFLKQKQGKKIDKKILTSIKKNTLATMFQKLGTIVVNATDNLVLSKFVGLITVGLYSNYFSIISAVDMLGKQMFTAITASVGNYNLTASKEDVVKIFEKALFINFWAYGFMSVCLYNLLGPFIRLWLGTGYNLSDEIMIVLAINFYLMGMRQSVQNFRNALGIYWQDKTKPICEAVVNLFMSIILVQVFGTIGVFLGTTISILTVTFWWEPHTLYKYGFECGMGSYYVRYGFYALSTFATAVLTKLLCGCINLNGILGLTVKLGICIVVINVCFLVLFARTNEFRGLKTSIISLVKRLSAKRKAN